jgi:putative ATP-dependent endonuclease of the OLD family
MQLKRIAVRNFRLLHDVDLLLEPRSTVIVGRNNSGKTSLTEVMRRVLGDNNPTFRLEDFSFRCHEGFWNAFVAANTGIDEIGVRKLLPLIEVQLAIEYKPSEPLGLLGEFIVDVDPSCTTALVVVRYSLSDGKLPALFDGLATEGETARADFFSALRERIPKLFSASILAVDPNDSTNVRAIDGTSLRALLGKGFISAQRGLDDASHKDRVVLGKILENLFATAKENPADVGSYNTAEELEHAIEDIQQRIGNDFNMKLDALLPALSIFGYPGLTDPKLRTETTLDVARLLTNHTKVRYTGENGVHLPEAYNGLGARNIILILLQLREFFKLYEATEVKPAVHIIFIEEPEVHLHPQMQEVFIRKLGEIVDQFSKELGSPWPAQFVVSTHSSHVANEAHFETIRYFLTAQDNGTGALKTVVKDLRKGLSGKVEPDRGFLHQYMTLTRCDLFFADKAILIEGTTERLLLPKIIRRIDAVQPEGKKLGSQYLSIIEIGGAYAHIFFDLLTFLELPTLVITDIDAVRLSEGGRYIACEVFRGERTSNACIKTWFKNQNIEPRELLLLTGDQKVAGRKRIAFQHPEHAAGPCGRSFEDAFMHANADRYSFLGSSAGELESQAWSEAQTLKKSEFALKLALTDERWEIPRYIRDGLLWLAENNVAQPMVQKLLVNVDVGAEFEAELVTEFAV